MAMDVDAQPCSPERLEVVVKRLAPWLCLAALFVLAVTLRHVLPANIDVSWLLGSRTGFGRSASLPRRH